MKLELTEDEVEFLHEYLFTEYEILVNKYGMETISAKVCYDLSQKIFEQLCEFKKQSYQKPIIYCTDITAFESENYQVIRYKSKNFMQQYLTMECKIIDNTYITDDFIFIKKEI